MTIYGAGGGRLSTTRKIKSSPKDLTIRKDGAGHRPIPFSQIRKTDGELSMEEFIFALNYQAHGRKSGQPDKADVLDEVSLQDIVRQAPNSCHRCHELIPGDAARQVTIMVRIPSVGAESVDCTLQAICESCSGTLQIPEASGAPPSDWKAALKPRQLEVWNMTEAGKTQTQVADALGLGQSDVSRILAACRKTRDGFLVMHKSA